MRQRLPSSVKGGMEFQFTPVRTAILIVLLVAFWLLGGFEHLDVGGQIGRAWLYSVIIFWIGSAMVSVVDHWVGNLDRTNLRWLYIVMGVLSIGGSFMYQHVLRERLRIDEEALKN